MGKKNGERKGMTEVGNWGENVREECGWDEEARKESSLYEMMRRNERMGRRETEEL